MITRLEKDYGASTENTVHGEDRKVATEDPVACTSCPLQQ